MSARASTQASQGPTRLRIRRAFVSRIGSFPVFSLYSYTNRHALSRVFIKRRESWKRSFKSTYISQKVETKCSYEKGMHLQYTLDSLKTLREGFIYILKSFQQPNKKFFLFFFDFFFHLFLEENAKLAYQVFIL